MIVEKINQYLNQNNFSLNEALLREVGALAENSFKRQFMSDKQLRGKGLYVSSSGDCARKLAYQYLEIPTEGKELDARARFNFFMGDLIELSVASLAKLSGCDLVNTGLEQLMLTKSYGDFEVSGHPDGILIAEENYLVEFKSMTDYSFDDFESGEIDRKYLAQVNLYMDMMKLNKCVFIAVNKVSGVIAEMILEKSSAVIENTIANLTSVARATPEALPDRPAYIVPNKKGILPYHCIYCPAWVTCWGDKVEKVVAGGAFKLRVKNDK